MNSACHYKRNRGGLTVMEGLASITVAATGFFAIIAIVPFAARRAQIGLDLDAGTALGKNAVQQFNIRGMGNVKNWRKAYLPGTPPATPGRNNVIMPETFWPERAVVIDPLFITNNSSLIDASLADPPPNPEIGAFPFPLFDGTGVQTIERINLASPVINPSTGLPRSYTLAHSKEIFRSINGLVFDAPEDKLDSPNQRYKIVDPTDNSTAVKRQTDGKTKEELDDGETDLSWMAMVIPEEEHPHLYRLYVIVFKNRMLNYRPGKASGEAVFEAIPIEPDGMGGEQAATSPRSGGGDFNFRLEALTDNRLGTDDYLNAGDWVLLTSHGGPGVAHGHWHWYRIQRVDNRAPNGGEGVALDGHSDLVPDTTNTVRVTLHGPDWADDFNPSTPALEARAIVLSNVVTVYEKTIRIEYDSIWNE